MHRFVSIFAVGIGLFLATTPILTTARASESPPTLRGGVSGNWADPAFSSQGVQIEIVDKRTAVVAWYTYDTAGRPLWLLGTGGLQGSRITAELLILDDGVFPGLQASDADVAQESWGQVEIDFSDCNNAEMSWQSSLPDFPHGSIELARVTALEGLPCGARERFEREIRFNLDAAPGQWEVLFSDYPVFQDDQVDKVFEWTTLPAPLSDRRGLKVGGTNRSDSLAMQLETGIGGLEPLTDYEVVQELTFATDVPSGCAGVGGSPGEGVYLHLGAAPVEPIVERVTDPDTGEERFEMNVDKGNQSQDGDDAIVVGNLANTQDCEDGFPGDWELKTVTSAGSGFTARTDGEGRLWVFGGTDSAFEDRSTYYVTEWVVRLRPVAADADGLGD